MIADALAADAFSGAGFIGAVAGGQVFLFFAFHEKSPVVYILDVFCIFWGFTFSALYIFLFSIQLFERMDYDKLSFARYHNQIIFSSRRAQAR
jgi:hypothetical protein